MDNYKKPNDNEKDKIREKYKGIDQSKINIIPAVPLVADLDSPKNAAVYVRVSTDDINQTTSYELQRNHYTDFINRHENWNLVKIYADEGISGTSLNHRNEFVQMMEDCKSGGIDLIITKSVSRFARNTIDCLKCVRELKELPKPVGVLFETEGIYTLDIKQEIMLTILATFAQEESHVKSDIMNASIDMRFKRGIFLTPTFLGYDVDKNGDLVINQAEAKIVRFIFSMYLAGSTCKQIADILTEYGYKTKKGGTKWSPASILYILQNERNCGDILARKTWTPNYLDHKSKKNVSSKPKYKMNDHHEGIVKRDDYLAVQHLISNAKYGYKGGLPELNVIKNGVLNGFVVIHPKWSAFTAEDYFAASKSVPKTSMDNINLTSVSKGFDLSNYQVTRSQFFEIAKMKCVTFSFEHIIFSSECVRQFQDVSYIEMLIHPAKKLFVVRAGNETSKRAVKWAKVKKSVYYAKFVYCSAYIRTLYEILGWNLLYKYRARGIKKKFKDEILIIFNLDESEIFITQNSKNSQAKILPNDVIPFTKGPKKDIMAYPNHWGNAFGNDYYNQAQAEELKILNAKCIWENDAEEIPYIGSEGLNVTSREEIMNNIADITKNEFKECNNG